jgi:acetyl-CoA carboxylase biotin carboxylase subunit
MVDTEQEALETAKKIGYPVLIKAVAGGGGRGMRVVHNDISLIKGYHTARAEAEKAFGNSGVYVEKFIENPRHIEYQILGDGKGKIIHLGERDCSIQRRNQKLIEESPSPFLEQRAFRDLRKKMSRAAIKLAETAQYTNAGTVEFVVDEKGNFYFLEMNKRIQVEHPVTEEVTGIDLVQQQILIAMGEPLRISQGDVKLTGHSIECRINAEDPFGDFRPSPGRIDMLFTPGGRGVRWDSHVYAGYSIPPYYDSMIGKLITYGKDRRDAMNKMSRALSEFMLTGIKTTIPFQQAILQDPDFRRGVYTTHFISRLLNGGGRELIEVRS